MSAYTKDQIASGIIAEGRRSRNGEGQLDHPAISDRGIVIALATALVETGLVMYANRSDPASMGFPHDAVSTDANSSGVFQQRDPWWGTAADRMDVARSAAMFYGSLARQRIGNQDYNTDATTPGLWAQMVQRSAYPHKYDQRMSEARQFFSRLSGAPVPPSAPVTGWTGDPVWLPEVLQAAGLVCHIYPGAYERGHGDMGRIWGVMAHHTGSFGETPQGIAQHPKLGLASQLYLSRTGEYTLCGVGIAWHGGNGSYHGISDVNGTLIGIEAANDGGGDPRKPLVHRSSWPGVQYDAYVRGVAAILGKLGRGSDRCIGHKEWAGDAQGKWDPGQIDMNIFRSDVARYITQGTGDDMANVPQDEWNKVRDAVIGPQKSRSIYRNPDEAFRETAGGIAFNIDAMIHQELIERLAVQYHDPDAIRRITAVAAGKGAATDVASVQHAITVLQKIPLDVLKEKAL